MGGEVVGQHGPVLNPSFMSSALRLFGTTDGQLWDSRGGRMLKRLLTVPIMKLAWLKPVTHTEVLLGVPLMRCVQRNCDRPELAKDLRYRPMAQHC